MQGRAAGRITILPGSGITAANAPALVAATGVNEIHASCAADLPQDARAVALGFTGPVRRETDAARVRALKESLRAAPV